MEKLIEFLNKIFASKVTSKTTYYYNDKKVDKLPKEAKGIFDHMDKMFGKMDEMFDEMSKMFDNF